MGTTIRPSLLLERDKELAAIDRLLGESCAGDGRLLLVEGPAGIGKTRLMAETRRRAQEAGVRVLTARGSELERDFPFGVVRQLFEPLLMAGDTEALFAGSAAPARPVLAPLDETAQPLGDASFAALHGLYWLSVNLCGDAPLLLSIDDLHWCDRASLRFLSYLARRMEGLPLLVVGSLRPAEPGADAALIAELERDPLAVVVRPAPLSEAAAVALVDARLGGETETGFAEACHRATGGNPLLLNELLLEIELEGLPHDVAHVDIIREIGPRAVARAVEARLARVSQRAAAVARAASVLGDGADVARAGELADLPEHIAADAVAELARAEVLRPELPLAFVHPLVRAAVYHGIAPGERERQHLTAAGLLRAAGAAADQVAAHLLATQPRGDAETVETLVRAGTLAMGRGAGEGAIAYLERALAEPPATERRAAIHLGLGAARALQNGPSAIADLRAAYDGMTDPADRGRVARELSNILMFNNRVEEAVSLLEESISALPEGDDDLRLRLTAELLGAANWDFTVQPFDDPRLTGARGELAADTPGARMLAGTAAYLWMMASGPATEVAALARRATSDGVLVEVDNCRVPQIGAAIAMVLAEDDAEAVRVFDMVLAKSYASGSLFEAGGGMLFRGLAMLRRGDLGEAARMLDGALERVLGWGSGDVVGIAAAHVGDFEIERGDVAAALRVHDLAQATFGSQAPGTNASWWLAFRMRLLLATGDPEQALTVSQEAESRFVGTVTNPAVIPWRSLRAQALHLLGRSDEAVRWAESEVPLSRQWGAPRTFGISLRVLGTVSGDISVLKDAVSVLEGSSARLELAKALAAYGTALRLDRRPTEAREPLRRALELASVCEAPPLIEHVRREIYATGARPRTDALSGVAALTSSERRVADLASEGQSNKDIAQALYVTPKTIEVHLGNVYRKLGIKSRRELAGALAA